jgi:hypothetical protein
VNASHLPFVNMDTIHICVDIATSKPKFLRKICAQELCMVEESDIKRFLVYMKSGLLVEKLIMPPTKTYWDAASNLRSDINFRGLEFSFSSLYPIDPDNVRIVIESLWAFVSSAGCHVSRISFAQKSDRDEELNEISEAVSLPLISQLISIIRSFGPEYCLVSYTISRNRTLRSECSEPWTNWAVVYIQICIPEMKHGFLGQLAEAVPYLEDIDIVNHIPFSVDEAYDERVSAPLCSKIVSHFTHSLLIVLQLTFVDDLSQFSSLRKLQLPHIISHLSRDYDESESEEDISDEDSDMSSILGNDDRDGSNSVHSLYRVTEEKASRVQLQVAYAIMTIETVNHVSGYFTERRPHSEEEGMVNSRRRTAEEKTIINEQVTRYDIEEWEDETEDELENESEDEPEYELDGESKDELSEKLEEDLEDDLEDRVEDRREHRLEADLDDELEDGLEKGVDDESAISD